MRGYSARLSVEVGDNQSDRAAIPVSRVPAVGLKFVYRNLIKLLGQRVNDEAVAYAFVFQTFVELSRVFMLSIAACR